MLNHIKPKLKAKHELARNWYTTVDATPAFDFIMRLERFAEKMMGCDLSDATKKEGLELLNKLAGYAGTFIETNGMTQQK